MPLDAIPGFDPAIDAIRPVVIAGETGLVAGLDCAEAIAAAQATAGAGGAGGAGASAGAAGAGAAEGGDGAGGAGGAGGGEAPADGSPDAPDDAPSDGATDASHDAGDAGDAGDVSVEAPPQAPALRAAELAVIPAGTLAGAESYLLVLQGCIGGPAFVDPIDDILCGTGYSAGAPTLAMVLVALSRQVADGKLGLQVVNASRAASSVDLRSTPPESGPGGVVTIATKVLPGAIRPKQPSFAQPVAGYGVPLDAASLEVLYAGSSVASLIVPWSTARAQGALDPLADGKGYTLVLIGPRPGVGAGSWWNASTLTLVANDP
jgi:hypothetical protein